uniref:Uncharacterized protein n=1 Tax=Tanacetum cinerariifolium TaxID=118510 RepID=A0A6L2KUS7_TANCI|nr:hypothetical protein [Tanacetum cinerariifolium]
MTPGVIIGAGCYRVTRVLLKKPQHTGCGNQHVQFLTMFPDSQGNPQQATKDKGVIDSDYSRHMTGNISFLSDFEEIDGGYVAFGGNPKGGKISGKGKIKTDKLDFDDVYFVKDLKLNLFSVSKMVPKENNMYNVDLKNVVSLGGLTCRFLKDTLDESNLWHRRLGHRIFKTMNKLVKGNLVREIGPKWLFDIDTLTMSMNYQPVVAGNQPNDNVDDDDVDAAFDVKENESDVHVSANGSDKTDTQKHDEKAKRDDKGKNMPELEDIVYSDDEKDVGAEVDLSNLETNIPGHTQEEGIDYDEVFAPVARIEAIRLFLAYASFMGFMVFQMDVKSAFLYGTIEEEVYVDDIIFGSTNKELCKAFEKLMKDKFQMSSTRELTFFLGLQVKQKDDGIFISQDKYVAEILRKFGFSDVKSASTPIETEKPLLKDPDGEDMDVHIYRSMIGSLMYLTSSIPDIMFVVCACARFQVISKVSHLHPVKRSFSLLKVAVVNLMLLGHKLMLSRATATVKKVNDDVQLRALIDGKKELARMGYEKPLLKLTFCKAFFSTQWMFLIHTLVQCLSAKRTAWNEFSYFMASVVICLATGRKFNFSKYIFDSMVRNVDSPSKFLMYPRFLQVVMDHQVYNMTTLNTRYTSPALTQKVFANMRRVGKGFFGVETPLFAFMPVQPQPQAEANVEIPIDPAPPSTTRGCIQTGGKIAAIDADEGITLMDVETDEKGVAMDTLIKLKAEKAKLLDEQIAQKLHDEEVQKAAARDKQEKANMERALELQRQYDYKEENIDWSVIAEQVQERHLDLIKKYQNLKKKPIFIAQARKNMIIYLKNMAGYKMEFFRGMTYDKVRPIFEREYKKVQTLCKPDKDVQEAKKNRVANETLLQETNDPKEMTEEDVQNMLEIVPVPEFKVEGLQVKYPIIDWEIHTEREDLVALWNLVKEKFSSAVPSEDKEKALWVELKMLKRLSFVKYCHDPDDEWKITSLRRQRDGQSATCQLMMRKNRKRYVLIKDMYVNLLGFLKMRTLRTMALHSIIYLCIVATKVLSPSAATMSSTSGSKHIDIRHHFIIDQVKNGVVELYFMMTDYQLADIFTKEAKFVIYSFQLDEWFTLNTDLLRHNIHERPEYLVYVTGDDFLLGNLKFVPKGEKDEVFRKLIPKELITEAILTSPYYQQNLEMVARKPTTKRDEQEKTTSKAHKPKKPTPVKKPAPTKQTKPVKEKSTKPTPLKKAGKGNAHGQAPVSRVTIREPISVRDTPSPLDAKIGAEAERFDSKEDTEILNLFAGPNPEPMHEDFIATIYPKFHESMKHTSEEQVFLENPPSSSGTLSSMKNLDDDFTFGDHFIVDKPTKEEPGEANVEFKVESKENVALYESLKAFMDRENRDEFFEATTKSRKRR